MQAGPFLNGVFTNTGTRNARDDHTKILKALRPAGRGGRRGGVASDLADAADVILARRSSSWTRVHRLARDREPQKRRSAGSTGRTIKREMEEAR